MYKRQVIPPAIDTNIYKPLNIEKPNDEYDHHLLYIGPLNPDRFPLQIIKALKLIQDSMRARVKLLAISAPWRRKMELKYVRTLRALAKNYGVDKNFKINFKTLTENEKVTLIKQCDAFIYLPNPVSQKVIVPVDPPITPLEVMACGKPVVSTPYYSLKDILEECAREAIVKSLEARDIADKVIKALEHKQAGFCFREYVNNRFSIDAVSKLLLRIYRMA